MCLLRTTSLSSYFNYLNIVDECTCRITLTQHLLGKCKFHISLMNSFPVLKTISIQKVLQGAKVFMIVSTMCHWILQTKQHNNVVTQDTHFNSLIVVFNV